MDEPEMFPLCQAIGGDLCEGGNIFADLQTVGSYASLIALGITLGGFLLWWMRHLIVRIVTEVVKEATENTQKTACQAIEAAGTALERVKEDFQREMRQSLEKLKIQAVEKEVGDLLRFVQDVNEGGRSRQWQRASCRCTDARELAILLQHNLLLGEDERASINELIDNFGLLLAHIQKCMRSADPPQATDWSSQRAAKVEKWIEFLMRIQAHLRQIVFEVQNEPGSTSS